MKIILLGELAKDHYKIDGETQIRNGGQGLYHYHLLSKDRNADDLLWVLPHPRETVIPQFQNVTIIPNPLDGDCLFKKLKLNPMAKSL